MTRHLGPDDVYRFRDVADPRLSPDGRRVAFVVSEPDRKQDRDVPHVWVASTEGGEPVQWTYGESGETSPRWSPDGRRLAFLARRGEPASPQVWVMDAAGGEARRLTAQPGGVLDLAWSPSGDRIAYVALIRPPAEEPAAQARPVVARRLHFKADGFGLVGEARMHLFVARVEDGDTRQLTDGDLMVSGVAWSPDGGEIAYVTAAHQDRDLDMANHVFAVEAAGGKPRRITDGPGTAALPRWSPDGSRIYFVGSERAGDPMASLYAVDAGPDGPAPASHLLEGFDRKVMAGAPGYPGAPHQVSAGGETVVFCARIGGCVHAFRLHLAGGRVEPLVGGEDRIVSGLSAAGGLLAFLAATPEHPADLFLRGPDGQERRLTWLNRELLAEVAVVAPERRRFRAPDGLEFDAFLYRPQPADGPAPLLLDIHGGPHNAIGPAIGPLHLYWQELAARGWCVVAPNPRGSDGCGRAFMESLMGGWGEKDLQDFTAVVDALVADGTADPERLAVTGYSYGGYMTSWLVGHTSRFQAAVAGGVVTDLRSTYGTSDVGASLIGQLAVGAELPDAWQRYDELSPLRCADRIETPLLILHGEADDRCDIGQAEQLFAVLRRRRKVVELVRYPDAGHVFILNGRPSHRADYQRRVVEWVTR
jgi:dipeptidyl aminopeptidase/acylaminoacyl peptidase